MTALRVLHLVHTPGPGGTESVVANLLAWVPPHEAVQSLACPDGPLASTARGLNLPWYPVSFDALTRLTALGGLARSIAALPTVTRQLAHALDTFAPDIVHAHGAKAAVLAARYGGTSRGRVLVWHLHDYLPLGILRSLWIRRARRAEGIVAVSHDVAEHVLGRGSDATIIPNAIAPQPPADKKAGMALLASLGVPSGPVIGYAGRLDREKGVHVLLRAFARLTREEPHAHLLIAGSSPFRAERALAHLVRLSSCLGVHDRVHFLGRLSDLTGFYGALTVLAHPAPREPFGLVILEALARGIPVVAFAAGGSREILEPFDPSLLVPPGDVEAYAATCRRALTDAALQAHAQRNGPTYVSTRFAPEGQCGALLALYRRLRGR